MGDSMLSNQEEAEPVEVQPKHHDLLSEVVEVQPKHHDLLSEALGHESPSKPETEKVEHETEKVE
jgi:hypothetical protein